MKKNFEEKKEALAKEKKEAFDLEEIVKDLISVTNTYPLTRVIDDMDNYAEKRNNINGGKDIPDYLAFQRNVLEDLSKEAEFYIFGGNSYLNVRKGIFSDHKDLLEKVISLVKNSDSTSFIILVEDYSNNIGEETYIKLIKTSDKPVIAISLKGAV